MGRKRDEAISIPAQPWPEFKARFLAWVARRRERDAIASIVDPEDDEEDIPEDVLREIEKEIK